MNEIRMDTLSLQMYNDLLWSFHERIIVTPDTAPLVLKLILTLATHRPDKLPTKPVIQLWKKIISVSSDGKSLVQKVSIPSLASFLSFLKKFHQSFV